MSPDEKLFWVLLSAYTIFGGTGSYLIVERPPWSAGFWVGVAYSILGFGGLIVLVRDRIHPTIRKVPLGSLRAIASLAFSVLMLLAVFFVFGIRHDVDAYMAEAAPRRITPEQSEKLRDYLSKHEASAVTIQVVQHDQEAMGYAAQLFFAMRQTNWDVNPPTHGGPNYIQVHPYVKRPKPDDLDASGKRLYKTPNDYIDAHDNWIESEIQRSIDQQEYDATGISIYSERPGQPENPDPRHPKPEDVLQDALRYAGIDVGGGGGGYGRGKYALFITVGHKGHGMRNQKTLFQKIIDWTVATSQLT